MSLLIRGVGLGIGLATLAVAGLVTATGASAESRLFSVRTTKPGVTIVQASLDHRDLRVAGQTGNATFFRIDNPSGPVPCANRLRFVASDGTSVDAPVDLCANNWTLTVATGGQASTQPTAPTAQVPGRGQPIAIATDDPNVTIAGVFISAQPITITARRDPYVQVFLPRSASGTQCTQDLGLALSDGRRIARQVDVCRSNSVVIVSLAGGGYAPPTPAFAPPQPMAASQPPVPPPPSAQLQPLPSAPLPPPRPPVATIEPPAPPMQWYFSAPGGISTITYATPGGGLGGLRAVCVAHTGSATITLGPTAPEVRPGQSVNVSIGSGTYRNTYSGIGSPRDEGDGQAHPILSVPLSDPLWAAMITERSLVVAVGRGAPAVFSLAGSSDQVKQFLNVCLRPDGGGSAGFNPPPGSPNYAGQFLPPPPPDNDMTLVPPVPGMGQPRPPLPPQTVNGPVNYVCDDGSNLAASFSGPTVTVMQYGAPPMTLYQAPSREGTRYIGDDAQLIGDGESVYWRRGGGDTLTCSPQ
jgi:hypothetical protein